MFHNSLVSDLKLFKLDQMFPCWTLICTRHLEASQGKPTKKLTDNFI